jgi:hypothetical protein
MNWDDYLRVMTLPRSPQIPLLPALPNQGFEDLSHCYNVLLNNTVLELLYAYLYQSVTEKCLKDCCPIR